MSPPDTAVLDPELEALGEAVRAARPRPRVTWAKELDARAAASFPRRRSRLTLPSLPRPTLLIPALGAAVCVLVALAVTLPLLGGERKDDVAPLSAASRPETQQKDAAAGRAGDAAGTSAPDATAQEPVPTPLPAPTPPRQNEAPGERDRKVERSATLALAANGGDLDEVSDGVIHATDSAGGFVASSQVDASGNGGSARFDLRVPTARLDTTLAALSKLAHVRSRTQTSDDVTGSVVTARERLTDAQAQRRALLRALGRARTGTQAEAIRARLRLARQEIAGARADLRSLDQRTTFSTVAVTVTASGESSGGGGGFGPGDAARDAVRILGAIAGGLVVGLAVLLPALLVGGALWLGGRAVRRRRREAALDAV
jgi:hypothetical protein